MRGVPPDPARSGRGRPADARDPARTRRADHRLPAAGQRGDGQAYVKVRERASYEYAIVSAAATVRLDALPAPAARGDHAARVALGSVAQRPWRLTARGGRTPRHPAHPRGAHAGHRARDGRRRAPAAERVQGDDGEKRGRSGPANGGWRVVTATRSARPAPDTSRGPLKLTGAARYAADHRPDGVLHAVLVGAPVAAGRLRGVDAAAALALPGVTAVLTAADLPDFPELPPPSAVRVMPFSDDRIRYEGQPVAIVLAESVEAAEAGRAAVVVDCERDDAGADRARPPRARDGRRRGLRRRRRTRRWPPRRSPIEQTYLQPPRHHHAMETSGTVARWDGGRLTLWDAVQASSTVIAGGERRVRPRRRGRARDGAAHRRRVRRQGLHLAARDPRGRRGPGGRPPGQAAPAAPGPVQQRGLPAVDGADDPARRDRRRRAARPRARGRQQHGPGRHPRRAGHRGQQVAVRRAGPAAAPAGRAGQPRTCPRRCGRRSRGPGCGRWRAP